MQSDYKHIEPQTSIEDAWQQLKPMLDAEHEKRKTKKRFGFFWITMLCGLGIGVATFYGLQTTTHPIADNKNFVIKNNELQQSEAILNDKVDNQNKSVVIQSQQQVGTKAQLKDNINKVSKITHQLQNNVSSNVANELSNYSSNNKLINENNSSNKTLNQPQKNNLANQLPVASNNNVNIEKLLEKKSTPITQLPLHNKYNPTAASVAATLQQEDKNKVAVSKVSSNEVNNKNNNKVTAKSATKNWSYGLIFNYPISSGSNFYDINGNKQLAALLIPTAFVTKHWGKHQFQFQFNPYHQYFVNNKALIQANNYKVKINTIDVKEDITYTEQISYNKLIGIEAGLIYQYQLTNKINVGLGISNTWLQAALLQSKIIRNYTQTTKDSVYGINNSDAIFSTVNTNLLIGKLQAEYRLKAFSVGVNCSQPLNNVFNLNTSAKMPVNTNLYVRWAIY